MRANRQSDRRQGYIQKVSFHTEAAPFSEKKMLSGLLPLIHYSLRFPCKFEEQFKKRETEVGFFFLDKHYLTILKIDIILDFVLLQNSIKSIKKVSVKIP